MQREYAVIGRIENNLHWCLDVLFCDDECTVLDRNAVENLAIIRRIVYNRIKMLSKMDTLSMGKRSSVSTTIILELRSFFHAEALPQEVLGLEFMDKELAKEEFSDKTGILDVKLKLTNGTVIDIEISFSDRRPCLSENTSFAIRQNIAAA